MKNKILKQIRKLRYNLNLLRNKEVKFSINKKINKEYIGSDYGGFFICPDKIKGEAIVYSFGIGNEISFDIQIIKEYKAKVWAFDPTPKSINWIKEQTIPKNFKFSPVGIADYDGEETRHLPENENYVSCTNKPNNKGFSQREIKVEVKKLSTIMKELGHTQIDILKMDIKGSEYEVLEDILTSEIKIKQILVEFHHRFSNIPKEKTEVTIKLLKKYRYDLFAVSNSYQEFSFIRKT